MEEKFVDYYHLLEVNVFASKEALKAAYKRLSIKYHPDNGGNQKYFTQISEAYHTLVNNVSRKKYLLEWKENKFLHNEFCKYPVGSSYEDFAFQPIREVVHEYMFYIMNNEYDKAYHMLCKDSYKKIYKKDFIKWQELVSEVHEILSYESAFETMIYDEDGIYVVFQVKIKEHNMLLNRQEEDYFKRILVFEDNNWKVKLSNINIRQIIKKYRQIIEVNKRRSKRIGKKKGLKYHTRYIDIDSLMQNIEYEFLRFKRYERVFGLLTIKVKDLTFKEQKKLVQIVEVNTRITDSFSVMQENIIIILLPETNEGGIKVFQSKLVNCLENEGYNIININSVINDQLINSSKELVNKILLNE